MGICFMKPKKSAAEISPSDHIKSSSPIVKLYGSPTGALTSFIRVAFLYKTTVSLHFVPSEIPNFSSGADSDTPVIQYGSDTVTGSPETMLRYIDGKFPNPPLLKNEGVVPGIVIAVTLQHRSMLMYLDSMVKWAEDLGVRGKARAVDPTMGSCGMEMKKFGRSYSQLLEFMLEHAQMEERVIFPVLERADRGLSRAANEDHSRDLPIMNGIKEDIKSIGVIQAGSPFYQEALFNLSYRLKLLQEHFKVHFEEEEKELLPLLEAIELNAEQHDRMVEQCLEVMESTHSHLFSFLILGLLPQDAMQYLSLITRWIKKEPVSSMLLTLMKRLESKTPLKLIGHSS